MASPPGAGVPWAPPTGPASREELEAFENLKPRLVELWSEVFPHDDAHFTSVVVPSISLEASELARIPGVAFLEEILLFLLIRLRNPRARLVYVTSQPIHPVTLEYYLQFLIGVPAAHARARLTLLCTHDASLRPLTAKVLERPRLLQRIAAAIPDPSRAYLTTLDSTPLERRLAVRLRLPLNGADPELAAALGTRSGGRRIAAEAGLELTEAIGGVRDRAEVVEAVRELRQRHPDLGAVAVRLDRNFQGEGNALLRLPPAGTAIDERVLSDLQPGLAGEVPESYLERLGEAGALVEVVPDDPARRRVSVQFRVSPRGQVSVGSTHDELLGGPDGLTCEQCVFPAREPYRLALHAIGARAAEELAKHGVASRASIECDACRRPDGSWGLQVSELNFGVGGMTHPLLAVRFLSGGHLDADTGLFLSPAGVAKYYRATDRLQKPAYRGLLPEDLVDILTLNHLHYSHRTESGALFYVMGALSEFGRVGVVAIGRSPEDADGVFNRVVEVLDRETGAGAA